jgi:hypothetical protein
VTRTTKRRKGHGLEDGLGRVLHRAASDGPLDADDAAGSTRGDADPADAVVDHEHLAEDGSAVRVVEVEPVADVHAGEEGDVLGREILVVELPAALNVDDARVGPISTRKIPGVAGFNSKGRGLEVALEDVQGIVHRVDGGELGRAAEGLDAGDFILDAEGLEEVPDLCVWLSGQRRVGVKDDAVPRAEVCGLVAGGVLLGPGDELVDLGRGEGRDQRLDFEVDVPLGEGCLLGAADEALDDFGARGGAPRL